MSEAGLSAIVGDPFIIDVTSDNLIGTSAACFDFSVPIKTRNFNITKYHLKLQSAFFPCTQYNVKNDLSFVFDDGSLYTAVVEAGYYNIDTLRTALQTAINALAGPVVSISIDSTKLGYNYSFSVPVSIRGDLISNPTLLGLAATATASLTDHVSDYPVRLDYPNHVIIRITNAYNTRRHSKIHNILGRLGLNGTTGSIVSYENSTDHDGDLIFLAQDLHILRMEVLNPDGTFYEFRGAPGFTLEILATPAH